jgi:Amiloride-sensitive sodium channel
LKYSNSIKTVHDFNRQVFFTELKYTTIESKEAYTFLAMLCDIGGALGLVLGSTLLTFCELADVFIVAICGLVNARRTKAARSAVKSITSQSEGAWSSSFSNEKNHPAMST